MTQPEALRLADLLLSENAMDCLEHSDDAATELRRLHEENQALRQALVREQEPVAWMYTDAKGREIIVKTNTSPYQDATPLYTAPPKREWVGLTAKELFEHEWWHEETAYAVNKFLKEKNND